MLTENTEGDIPVVVALKSVKSTILNKITSKPRDQVGVVLYGTVCTCKNIARFRY